MAGTLTQSRFKIAASLILGWTGTAASLFSLDFSAGSFSISIVWAQVFPLLAAFAYGPRYGLVACIPGLFAFSPFLIWPENGYANIVVFALLVIWFPWQGYCMRRIEAGGPWFWHPLLMQAPYAILYGLGIYYLYPPVLALNPAPWAPNAETSISLNLLTGICLKSAYAMGFAVLTALFVLKTPPVRRLLQLPVAVHSRLNGRIFLVSIASLFLLWVIYRGLTALFLGMPVTGDLVRISTPQDVIALLNFLLICLLGGYLVSIYTERRIAAEDALRESEFLFRSQFDFGNIGIAITGLNKRWLRANPYLLNLLGYSEEELLSKTWVEMSHPDDLDSDVVQFEKMLSGELDGYEMDKRFLRADGEIVYTHLTVSCYRNAAGAVQFFIASVADITERTELEHQLRHAQKLEAIGQLAGGVAHDFNNLLQVISGYGTIALDDARERRVDPEDLKALLAASDRATTLVRQILAFGRRQILTLEPLDLDRLLREFLAMIRRVLPENIAIILEVAPDLHRVHADRGQVEQVLMNLCVNARDAMPAGGEIRIGAENSLMPEEIPVGDAAAREAPCVKIEVADTGAGMDAATVERIFEPFFSTKGVGEGTGLGLATVYGIVRQHNGAITVQSAPGKGTCFTILLPAYAGKSTEVRRNDSKTAALGSSEVILVAEDDEQVRGLVTRMLSAAGYRVLVAGDGEEAVRHFEEQPGQIHLFLFDVVMPKLGGVAALERLRGLGATQPAIFASGYSEDAVADEAVGLGAVIIQKPYRREALLHRIREVLDN